MSGASSDAEVPSNLSVQDFFRYWQDARGFGRELSGSETISRIKIKSKIEPVAAMAIISFLGGKIIEKFPDSSWLYIERDGVIEISVYSADFEHVDLSEYVFSFLCGEEGRVMINVLLKFLFMQIDQQIRHVQHVRDKQHQGRATSR